MRGSAALICGVSRLFFAEKCEKSACNPGTLVVYYTGNTHALLCSPVPARVGEHACNAEVKTIIWRI